MITNLKKAVSFLRQSTLSRASFSCFTFSEYVIVAFNKQKDYNIKSIMELAIRDNECRAFE